MLISIFGLVVGIVFGFMAYPAFYFVFQIKERFYLLFLIKRNKVTGFILVTLISLFMFMVYLAIGFSFNSFLNRMEEGATLGRYHGLGFFVGVGIFSLLIGRAQKKTKKEN